MSNYSDFAFYYDSLTNNVNYAKRAMYFDMLIKKFCISKGKYLVDLACGTGSLSEEFFKLGYDVIGIDNSEDMLGAALEKKYDNNSNIQYICQDMTSFELYGNADIIVCALDSINHLETPNDIRKTIERAYLFLEFGGVFIFDANTSYKHREILGDNAFVFENEKVFCAWQNSYIPENNKVDISLDFFEKNENGNYIRYSEDFSEIAPETDTLKKFIINAGFEIVAIYDEDSINPINEKSQRIIFCCRKSIN